MDGREEATSRHLPPCSPKQRMAVVAASLLSQIKTPISRGLPPLRPPSPDAVFFSVLKLKVVPFEVPARAHVVDIFVLGQTASW